MLARVSFEFMRITVYMHISSTQLIWGYSILGEDMHTPAVIVWKHCEINTYLTQTL